MSAKQRSADNGLQYLHALETILALRSDKDRLIAHITQIKSLIGDGPLAPTELLAMARGQCDEALREMALKL